MRRGRSLANPIYTDNIPIMTCRSILHLVWFRNRMVQLLRILPDIHSFHNRHLGGVLYAWFKRSSKSFLYHRSIGISEVFSMMNSMRQSRTQTQTMIGKWQWGSWAEKMTPWIVAPSFALLPYSFVFASLWSYLWMPLLIRTETGQGFPNMLKEDALLFLL